MSDVQGAPGMPAEGGGGGASYGPSHSDRNSARAERARNAEAGGSNNALVSGMRQQREMKKKVPGLSMAGGPIDSKMEELEPYANYLSNTQIADVAIYVTAQNYSGAAKILLSEIGVQEIRRIADERDSATLSKIADAAEKIGNDLQGESGILSSTMPAGAQEKLDSVGRETEGEPIEGSPQDQGDGDNSDAAGAALGAAASGSQDEEGPEGGQGGDDGEPLAGGQDQQPEVGSGGQGTTPTDYGSGVTGDAPESGKGGGSGKDDGDPDSDDSGGDKEDSDEDDEDEGAIKKAVSGGQSASMVVAMAPYALPILAIAVVIAILFTLLVVLAGGFSDMQRDRGGGGSMIPREDYCYVDPDAGFSGTEPLADDVPDRAAIGSAFDGLDIDGLSETQIRNAVAVYELSTKRGVEESAARAAFITAMAETELHNYANSGGSASTPEIGQQIAASVDEDNDGIELDGNAVGVFGLTFPQWGSISDLMDPASASRKFLNDAVAVTGYEDMEPVDLAKEVMSPTSPDTYDAQVSAGNRIYDALASAEESSGGGDGSNSGPSTGGRDKGSLIVPMAKGDFTVTSGFGPRWGTMHSGLDLASPNDRAPLFAVADAKVVKAEPASGYGNWVILGVTLDSGEYIEALYGHMAAGDIFVSAGDTVTGGQRVALQGSEGEVTGPHLHFGIYPGGWTMDGAVDPVDYLMLDDPLPLGEDGNLDTSSLESSATGNSGDTDDGWWGWASAGEFGEAGDEWGYLDDSAIDVKIDTLDDRQVKNAREIVRQTEAMGMSKHAATVALATAMQESTLLIYANSVVPESLNEPHEAIGQDHDSVGLFQQRYPMWSSDVRELMTPWSSTKLFLEGLQGVGGWEDMPVTVAAQTVQRSAYPDAYAKWEPLAKQLADKLYDGSGEGASPSVAESAEGGSGYSVSDVSSDFTSPDTDSLRYVSDTFCVGEDGTVFTVDDKFGMDDQGVAGSYTPGAYRQSHADDDGGSGEGGGSGDASDGDVPEPSSEDEVKPTGDLGKDIVQYALAWRGTTYAWGGGNHHGPSKGIRDGGAGDAHGDYNKIGFDCSGLVMYAVYQASNGEIALPHYSGEQSAASTPIEMDELRPGDAIYMGPGPTNTKHVVIYMGDGKVVEAPQSGDVVKVSELSAHQNSWPADQLYPRRFE